MSVHGVYQPELTANDRFKRSYRVRFWASITMATIAHTAVMASWPEFEVAPVEFVMREIEAVELPPEITIPPAPEAIARPANPVVTSVEIDTNVTISPTTFEANQVAELLPPPAEVVTVDVSAQPTFTPYEVAPELTNRSQVQQALIREYPAVLRDAGIGGTVLVHFFIDAAGSLENILIAGSSGFDQLDQAALRVAEVFRFSPAMNRDERVAVWIQIPITFTTQ